jgi:hypothetical protein
MLPRIHAGDPSAFFRKNLPPLTFKKHKGIEYFEVPAGTRGQRCALRNHKGVVFP